MTTPKLEKGREKERQVQKQIGIAMAIAILIFLAAASKQVLILRIYGNAMSPTVTQGDFVVVKKTTNIAPGDLLAFRMDEKLLIRRAIAISEDGVSVKIQPSAQTSDDTSVAFGEHKSSLSARNTGEHETIEKEAIFGKLIVRILPFKKFGKLD